MSTVPRAQCPIEAEHGGSERGQLVGELLDRQEGVDTIHCFTPSEEYLEDEQLQELKDRVTSCNTCVQGTNCPLGGVIMKAQFTEQTP